MNALLATPLRAAPTTRRRHAVLLLGTGVVGGAFLKLLDTPAGAALALVGAANSRHQQTDPAQLARRSLRERLHAAGAARDDAALLAALDASDAAHKVIVDASASATLAARHPAWLARGYHVVTANKALAGGDASGWRALQTVRAGGARYGDAATVGAGLPVLSTLRRLHACGDALLSLEGVLSGSLSWLFNHYDGARPFSALLREARARGYTEPDARADLSGEDVARKLLILARTAGFALTRAAVQVENLVPASLRALDAEAFRANLEALDAPLAARHAAARAHGRVLRHIARIDARGNAQVGLVEVAATHPAAHLAGTDNLFALGTTRYRERPLVIQGPGAGPEVTAQALLGDVLAPP
jgi:aspartokinase/homoserine dehydrogenase 1